MIVSEWRAYPIRVVMAVLAIAMGVALGFAVHLINASALGEFDRALRTVSGDADLQVHATSAVGFDESLYPRLAHVSGIDVASPVIELSGLADDKLPITVVGLDVFRAASVSPRLLGQRSDGQVAVDDLLGDRTVFLSDAVLKATGKRIGDDVLLSAAGHAVHFRIAGDLPGVDANDSIATLDIAAAQWRFGQLGKLQRVDLRLKRNALPADVSRAVTAALPVGAEIVSRESQERRSNGISQAYRVNLDMLAMMALLTGGFLVYSAQSLSVARRRPQFALLRVLGTVQRGLLAQVFVEAVVIGVIGAALGVGLGLGLAAVSLHFLGSDLGGGYFQGSAPKLVFAPIPALVFGAMGVGASLLGSLVPASEAGRSTPAIAIKNLGDAVDPRVRPRIRGAVVFFAAAAVAAWLPAVDGVSVFGYLAVALLLAGGVAAMPWLARALLAPLRWLKIRNTAVSLAIERLWGAPSQASVALVGIVASTSLMIAMAVMVASFRGSVESWLGQVLPADIYLTLDNSASGAGFDPATQTALRNVPGVAWATFLKDTPIRLDPGKPAVALLARPVGGPGGALPLLTQPVAVPAGVVPVWVSEPAAGIYGYHVGDRLTLPIAGAAPKVFVAGIWRDYARQHGAIVINDADYTRLTGDAVRGTASIALQTGVAPDAAASRLRKAMPPALGSHVIVTRPQEIRVRALAAFDRSFAITYLLEAIPILVGLAGVAATVSAQTLARTKEFGMLRHVGVLRREIVTMLVTEGALLGAVGGAAGIGLGLVMSQVLIRVVNPQSFHWSMDTMLPWPLFLAVAMLLVLATAGTALLAGRRALSQDAVKAVREDW